MTTTSGIRVLALVGSIRAGSYNRMLLRATADALGDRVELDVFDELKGIPSFDEDDETNLPTSVERLRERFRGADALLVVTPEYNGSVPGQLKNALDWVSRQYGDDAPIKGLPAAVIGASNGNGGARSSIADAQRILKRTRAEVLEPTLSVNRAQDCFDESGALADDELRGRIAEFADAFVAAVRLPAQTTRG